MLYHITSKENAEKILKEGLKPMLGPNSKLCGETEKLIYLCRRKDIPYWRILLNRDVVLQISEDGIVENDMETFEYTNYLEKMLKQPIKPKHIKKVYIPKTQTEQMKQLCFEYIYNLSRFCVICARYYYYIDEYGESSEYITETLNEIKHSAKWLKGVLPNLDYSVLTKQEIKDQIRKMGEDCEYTICDLYCMENKKLYQKLIEFGDDELSDDRKFVYDFIKKNLKGCLTIDTGGWCG